MSRALCWIRRDLRLDDHTALAEATRHAKSVAVVFVYDTQILARLVDRDDRRVTFIHRSLDDLDGRLKAQGSRLLTRMGEPAEVIPRLSRELSVDTVFANHDDDPYALQRDQSVGQTLSRDGRELKTFKDCVVFERDEVMNPSGNPYSVFTPYSKAWKARLTPADVAPRTPDLTRLCPESDLPAARGNLPLSEIGFVSNDLWLEPGANGAQDRLSSFLAKIDRYKTDRDFPALESTSGLSVHLRHGTVSVRQCFREALAREGNGASKWLDELIWREFYHMILAKFPHVVEEPFRGEYKSLEWPGTQAAYEAWEEGRTGFPLVDAAMRCLKATGWMHNRLRMVTAMFLTKDLLVDYRRGESLFARWLLDFELASNNGGWQWSASTGVDAQPYFRIFNPILQSRKFDPEAAFIKQWCPELAGFEPELAHWPHDAGPIEQLAAGCRLGEDYPHPIVDHSIQRQLAINLLSRKS
ncbi:MAG: deoxyribodipyrimidine photo-lyase [Fimbriimonadaceae bacterium]|nr:deoxyribodipyrimidine photo-lyase [Fimbriimonadaceae bacterium]QYK58359.1 MAG: deoxyribodipyrimidine photo-lyase [Fimbriimonadaceae bacterium]